MEVARFKTELTSYNDLLLTAKGDLLLVQGTLGLGTEAWDVANKKLLWAPATDSYAHQLTANEEEFLWLDQNNEPAAIVRTSLRTGKEAKRTPLKIEGVRLWNVEFAMGHAPLLVAQAAYSDGGCLVTFSVESGELKSIARLPKRDGEVIGIEGLGASPDGRRFLLATRGGLLLVDDQCQVLNRFTTANHVSRIRFFSSGKRAIAAGIIFGSPVYFLDLAGGKIAQRAEHRYGTVSLEMSADGKWAVSGGHCRMAAERNYYFRSKKTEGGRPGALELGRARAGRQIESRIRQPGRRRHLRRRQLAGHG